MAIFTNPEFLKFLESTMQPLPASEQELVHGPSPYVGKVVELSTEFIVDVCNRRLSPEDLAVVTRACFEADMLVTALARATARQFSGRREDVELEVAHWWLDICRRALCVPARYVGEA